MNKQDTLYYDGACPLCSAEMTRLGRLSDDGLRLVDIHQSAPRSLPGQRDQLLAVLHLETADGRILTGVDANVAAWQHTRPGMLFRWLRWPGIRRIADAVYNRWAAKRFRRLYVTGQQKVLK